VARLVADVVAVAGSSMRVLGLLLAGLLVEGCSESCQNTCARIYSTNECHVVIPGIPVSSSLKQCEQGCEDGLKNAGVMGDYDPYQPEDPEHPPILANEKQAAAWMDCVWSADCDQLDPANGICAPI